MFEYITMSQVVFNDVLIFLRVVTHVSNGIKTLNPSGNGENMAERKGVQRKVKSEGIRIHFSSEKFNKRFMNLLRIRKRMLSLILVVAMVFTAGIEWTAFRSEAI